jgi:hypothetical protein
VGDSLKRSSIVHRSSLSLGVCPGQYEGVQQHPFVLPPHLRAHKSYPVCDVSCLFPSVVVCCILRQRELLPMVT